MTRRRAPRPAAAGLQAALQRAAPKTPLAAAQAVWAEAVGEHVAAAARPVAEHEGAVVVACSDPVWVQELDLMQDRLLATLRDRLGDDAPRSLRFRVEDKRD
jgi:predicted nucleic acid-binding Zn ribbon protein